MTLRRILTCSASLVLPVLLSGCSYFVPTKRHLPVPKAPSNVQNATAAELVRMVDQRWDELNTLTITAEVTAHTREKDEPSIRCNFVLQKPRMFRAAGRYFGVKVFDMASNGADFTLVIPSSNIVVKGSNTATEKSAMEWENLRPNDFLDAVTIRGLDSDDDYMVASDTEIVGDAANKHLYIEPEYVLSVFRHKGGHENLPVRTITFHRDDMQPYDQYVYDEDGVLETQIFFSNYTTFSTASSVIKYPAKIVIKRPQEGLEFDLAVEQVNKNVELPEHEFEVETPKDATIKQLK